MNTSLLATKLYIPPPRPDPSTGLRTSLVERPHLVERLDEALHLSHRLTLISASAGSGKTTLLSEWIHASGAHRDAPLQVARLSLDEDDNEPTRFWAYAIAALQTIHPQLAQSVLPMLQGPQPPPARSILTPLLNEVAALSEPIVLVLDDYHLITEQTIHDGVTFLLDHLPQRLHLVIATRADPPLPIARLRARGQLTELRANDGGVVNTIPVGDSPRSIAFDGLRMWVTNSWDNTVSVLRASDDSPVMTLTVGAWPHAIAFDGANMWVVNSGDDTVSVLRASDGVQIATLIVGYYPSAIAFDGANMWVANESDNSVSER
jgi:YVTN family beta-propeller protein